MTKDDKKEFKVLIKEGTIEALKSSGGQDAIVGAMRSEGGQGAVVEAMQSQGGQDAIIGALRSQGGQGAIVDAMNNMDGQNAIKQGSLAALKSEEGQSILVDSFVESFHQAVIPSLDNMTNSINDLKTDVARIKESAVKREELTEIIKSKMKGLAA